MDDNNDGRPMKNDMSLHDEEPQPPLVAATLIDPDTPAVVGVVMEEGEHTPPSESNGVQADWSEQQELIQQGDPQTAVAVIMEEDYQPSISSESGSIVHANEPRQEPEQELQQHEQQQLEQQQHEALAQSVHLDETTSTNTAENHVEEKSTDSKSPLKLKVFLLLLSFIVLVGAVAATVATLVVRNNNSNNNNDHDMLAPSAFPNDTTTDQSPTSDSSLSPTDNTTQNNDPEVTTCIKEFVLLFEKSLKSALDEGQPDNFIPRPPRRLQDSSDFDDWLSVMSRDGSTAILRESSRNEFTTYDLIENESDDDTESLGELIFDMALSNNGERLALGVGSPSQLFGTVINTFKSGGSMLLYERNETNHWNEIDAVVVGGGLAGGAFSVSISGDLVAIVAGQATWEEYVSTDPITNFISVYRNVLSENDVLLQVGNSILNSNDDDNDNIDNNWINENTAVRLVENRMFVAGADDWLRILDLNDEDGIWQPVGSRIPWQPGRFHVSVTDPSIVVTVSNYNVLSVLEYQNDDDEWQSLDASDITEWISSIQEVSPLMSVGPTSVSPNGDEILVAAIGNAAAPYYYWVALFGRNSTGRYSMTGTVVTEEEGILKSLQITNDGDLVLATTNGFAVYARIDCTI